ncbi:MAG: ATP-binding cassette domain-containing protein, partial [Rhodospirillaceae bacterium]|nr:ATP-binding cassette domain-containing protein [Rhodospirillaceae bacterium]
AIFGCRQLEQGGMTLLGDAYAPEDPASAMQAGVSMLPEDRKEAGLFLNFSIADNVVAANLTAYSRNGLLNRKAINAAAQSQADSLRIAAPDIGRVVSSLSGGNQQKVLLGKWLVREPKLLIVDEPAAGMTDAETEATADLLKEIATEKSVIVVEHDMTFVRALGVKVTVLHEGSVLSEGTVDHVQNDAKVIEVYLGR